MSQVFERFDDQPKPSLSRAQPIVHGSNSQSGRDRSRHFVARRVAGSALSQKWEQKVLGRLSKLTTAALRLCVGATLSANYSPARQSETQSR
jgi:hypothetical protein